MVEFAQGTSSILDVCCDRQEPQKRLVRSQLSQNRDYTHEGRLAYLCRFGKGGNPYRQRWDFGPPSPFTD
jgi:hypothetical protein